MRLVEPCILMALVAIIFTSVGSVISGQAVIPLGVLLSIAVGVAFAFTLLSFVPLGPWRLDDWSWKRMAACFKWIAVVFGIGCVAMFLGVLLIFIVS